MHRLTLALGCAAVGVVALASPTRGDVSVAYAHEGLYTYEVTHVPDHDQRRAGLAADGSVHCVPASSMNWMCYFANHGQPGIAPGPANWANPVNYGLATTQIEFMGSLMMTAPPGGTDGFFAAIVLRAWLHDYPVLVIRLHLDDDYCPRAHNAAIFGMAGSYVLVGVGWYIDAGGDLMVRDGGHSLSLTEAARNGGLQEIGWRDPGSQENPQDLNAQSPFSTEHYAVTDIVKWPFQFSGYRVMSRIEGYGGNGHQGYIDSITVIQPMFTLTPLPDFAALRRQNLFSLAGSIVEPVRDYALAAGMTVVDMDFHPDGRVAMLVAGATGPARLQYLDLLTGEIVAGDDHFTLTDPTQVMVSRMRDVYVVDGSQLVRINADKDPPDIWYRTLPVDVDAMMYDGTTDAVMLFATDARQVLLYPYHLDANPVVLHIPPEVPIGDRARICWNAYDRSGWLASELSNSLWRMVISPETGDLVAQEITHPALTMPADDIQAADFGRIMVSVDGGIVEFEADDRGSWNLATPAWCTGVDTFGGPLLIPRSQTNYQVGKHDLPEYRDVLPDQFAEPEPDCDADVVENGVVNVNDLVATIIAWGQTGHGGFIRADVNRDGEVGVDDLVAVIVAWGPCP